MGFWDKLKKVRKITTPIIAIASIFYPPIGLLAKIDLAINEVEKMKDSGTFDGMIDANPEKTYAAVEKLMANEKLIKHVKEIVKSDDVALIKGYLFSTVQGRYEEIKNKFQKK